MSSEPTIEQRLRDAAEAYPEEVFRPLTADQRGSHPTLITQASAGMGRHFAALFIAAAERIAELEAVNKRLQLETRTQNRTLHKVCVEGGYNVCARCGEAMQGEWCPPPDGYASWEDWLLSKNVRIYEFDGAWKVEWDDGESDHPTYPTALEAAKKEAGR